MIIYNAMQDNLDERFDFSFEICMKGVLNSFVIFQSYPCT